MPWILKGSIKGPKGSSVRGQIGLTGLTGKEGRRGQDAPTIIDIKIVVVTKTRFYFVYSFSDGTSISSNTIELPEGEKIIQSYYSIGGGSSSGGGTSTPLEVQKDGIILGNAEKMDFTGDNVNVAWDAIENKTTISVDKLLTKDEGLDLGPTDTIDFKGPGVVATYADGVTTVQIDAVGGGSLTVLDEGTEISNSVTDINFVGDSVKVTAQTVLSQWDTLSDVTSMGDYIAGNPTFINVEVTAPSKFTFDKEASERIEKFELVRMDTQTTVSVGSLNDYSSAKVTAIALNGGNPGALITGLIFGVLDDVIFDFPINEPLFLQADGTIGLTAPSASGEFITKIGYSLGTGSIFITITDPIEIL